MSSGDKPASHTYHTSDEWTVGGNTVCEPLLSMPNRISTDRLLWPIGDVLQVPEPSDSWLVIGAFFLRPR